MAESFVFAVSLSLMLFALYLKVLEPYYAGRYSDIAFPSDIDVSLRRKRLETRRFSSCKTSSQTRKCCTMFSGNMKKTSKQLIVGLIASIAVFMSILMSGRSGFILISSLICAAGLLIASAADLRFRKIPNELCFIILLCGVTTGIYYGHLFEALAGGFAASILLILAKTLGGGVGIGDIKLMFSVGFFLGIRLSLGFFAITFALAAIVSLVLLILGKIERKTAIPLAPFACGSFAVVICFENLLIYCFGL